MHVLSIIRLTAVISAPVCRRYRHPGTLSLTDPNPTTSPPRFLLPQHHPSRACNPGSPTTPCSAPPPPPFATGKGWCSRTSSSVSSLVVAVVVVHLWGRGRWPEMPGPRTNLTVFKHKNRRIKHACAVTSQIHIIQKNWIKKRDGEKEEQVGSGPSLLKTVAMEDEQRR
jgi:hypothetical protein